MPKIAFASLLAVAFVVVTGFASPSAAETRHKHVEKDRADVARDRAAPGRPYGPYGMPGNYYPAPPFPFFLLPGPWWLPAHS
jgi:hypothetical protein